MTRTLTRLLATATLAGLAAASITATADDAFAAKQQAIIAATERVHAKLAGAAFEGNLDANLAMQIIEEDIEPEFNFALITQQALGKHWRKADAAQRAELTELFGNLLKRTYANALSRFTDQSFRPGDSKTRGDKGTVIVHVVDDDDEVAIEYLLGKGDGGSWDISDVKIERVSLLANYRRQFNSIVRKNGVDGLIDKLRAQS